jgi:hypothetical protein
MTEALLSGGVVAMLGWLAHSVLHDRRLPRAPVRVRSHRI